MLWSPAEVNEGISVDNEDVSRHLLFTLADFLLLELAPGTPPFIPIDCLLDDAILADVTAGVAAALAAVVVVAPPVVGGITDL